MTARGVGESHEAVKQTDSGFGVEAQADPGAGGWVVFHEELHRDHEGQRKRHRHESDGKRGLVPVKVQKGTTRSNAGRLLFS